MKKLFETPGSTVMTLAVIGVALVLPSGLYVTLVNLSQLSEGFDDSARITLYLQPERTEGEAAALRETLLAWQNIESVDYISSEEALAEFRRYSGFGEIVDELEHNPLPAVLVLHPVIDANAAAAESEMAQAEQLLVELNALPEVDIAQLDLEWLRRLNALMTVTERATAGLIVFLSLAVLLITGNTIRLAIESRRAEIVVVKLVGGTDSFVSRPFLYSGFWYGLGGGLLAWLLLGLILLWSHGPLVQLIDLYDSRYALVGLGLEGSLVLLAGSGLLGWLGAWLSVQQYLTAIEPD